MIKPHKVITTLHTHSSISVSDDWITYLFNQTRLCENDYKRFIEQGCQPTIVFPTKNDLIINK